MLLAVSQYNVQAPPGGAAPPRPLSYFQKINIIKSLSKDIEHLFLYFLQFIFH